MKKTLPLSKKTASYKAHKRDVFWQILFPVGIVLGLVIATSIFAATASLVSASLWADISVIWLLIPLLVFSFIFLLILGGLIYGMSKLLNITPIYSNKLHILIRRLVQKITAAADATVQPILYIDGVLATIKKFLRQ